MNNNMINPANYYNPFAKYNYISKTRGVYISKETAPLIDFLYKDTEKSANIFSDNYDAETDILESLHQENKGNKNISILGYITNLFKSSEN